MVSAFPERHKAAFEVSGKEAEPKPSVFVANYLDTEIQAATLSKPAMSTDDARNLLAEKLSHSIMEHREELIEALKAIDSTGDETVEQAFPAILIPVVAAVVNGAVAGAVGAGVAIAVQKG
ncbi:hypothetical protein MTO96_047698 [Rhipicephalus appendiculatus]